MRGPRRSGLASMSARCTPTSAGARCAGCRDRTAGQAAMTPTSLSFLPGGPGQGRCPGPGASIDLVIATRVSTVTDGVVRYRGRDALDLAAAGERFEAVAELLWAGPQATEPSWRLPAAQASSLGLVLGALGGGPVAMRFAAAVAAAAASGGPVPPARRTGLGQVPDRDPRRGIWPGTERRLADGPVARRLWQRWSPLSPTVARVRALDTALVLLAEHELPPPRWRSGSRRPRGPRRPAACSPGSAR